MKDIVVVGAGRMGQGIARCLVEAGKTVTLVDQERRVAEAARDTVADAIAAKQDSGWEDAVARLRVSGSLAGAVKGKDLVIEAVFESLELKQAIFEEVAAADPSVVMATNTSSFRVAEVAADASRTIGMHFFFPAHRNRLVELVAGAAPPPSVAEAKHVLEAAGKRVVVTGDARGFAVNRYLLAWAAEALRLAEAHGHARIERVARDVFGTPFGPFGLLEISGREVCRNAIHSLHEAHGVLYAVPDEAIDGVPSPLSGDAGDDDAIAAHLMGALVWAAAALVHEGVASKEVCDTGARFGLGWAKGPFELVQARPGLADEGLTAMAAMHGDRVPKQLP